MKWDSAALARAISVLAIHDNIKHALQDLKFALGEPVSYKSLDSAFRRNLLGSPTEYLFGYTKSHVLDELTALSEELHGYPECQPDGVNRVLFIPDTHAPFHDKKAWDLLCKVGWGFKPDVTAVLGDFCDFYAMSSHSKKPSRLANHAVEVDACNSLLDDVDSFGSKRKVYVCGNHEDRYDRYVADKAPELYGLVDIPTQLKLNERGWEWVPYRDYTTIGKLNITHDTGMAGGKAHQTAVSDFGSNAVIGHVHRINVTYSGNVMGHSHVGASFGWLGDAAEIDYMHKAKTARDWHLGFGTGTMLKDGTMFLQAHPIINYKTVVDGVVYEL